MKERRRGQTETRARALATQDRNYWLGLLRNVDAWWPVYCVRHPNADRAKIVSHLASLVDERRRRGFGEHHPQPVPAPESAVFFELSQGFRNLHGLSDLFPFGRASGVVLASDFKLIDVETKSKDDTSDLHVVAPLGSSSFAGARGARFWAGFARLDSTWDQVDIFHGSPSDRVVHMAVVRIDLPTPTSRVIATLRTSLSVTLPLGAEVINDWGFFDDEDDASLKIDLCGAFVANTSAFPDPQAFGFHGVVEFRGSSHGAISAERNMTRSAVVSPGDKPALFLGVRWTFAAADSRIQTGFTQEALDASFSFKVPDTGAPGVFFSYQPDLVLSQ